jgi:hypothetical protein
MADHDATCLLMDTVDELHRKRLPWLFKTPDSQPRSETSFADLLGRPEEKVTVESCGDRLSGHRGRACA